MGWPQDEQRREVARKRHAEALRKRWERPEEREKARATALRQFSDPEQRRIQSELKLKLYEEHPEVKERIAQTLSGRPQIVSEARLRYWEKCRIAAEAAQEERSRRREEKIGDSNQWHCRNGHSRDDFRPNNSGDGLFCLRCYKDFSNKRRNASLDRLKLSEKSRERLNLIRHRAVLLSGHGSSQKP